MSLVDLAYEIGLNPKKVSNTFGGEYHSECPSCAGSDRFIINPNRPMKNCYGSYWCRKCGIHGDTIQFCREYLGLSFKESLARANATIISRSFTTRASRSSFTPAQLIKPPDKWIIKANSFIESSHEAIFRYQSILEWLKKRGVDYASVTKYKLGWNDRDELCARTDWGLDPKFNENGKLVQLYQPMGLVIPTIDQCNGSVYRIKVRREKWTQNDKLHRYIAISGSMNGLNLFGARNGSVMICVESELDAIFIESVVGNYALAVAVGGSLKNPDNLTDLLAKSMKRILICHDNDEAGLNMLKKWHGIYPNAIALPTPVGKDIGEAIEQGFNVKAWISSAIIKSMEVI